MQAVDWSTPAQYETTIPRLRRVAMVTQVALNATPFCTRARFQNKSHLCMKIVKKKRSIYICYIIFPFSKFYSHNIFSMSSGGCWSHAESYWKPCKISIFWGHFSHSFAPVDVQNSEHASEKFTSPLEQRLKTVRNTQHDIYAWQQSTLIAHLLQSCNYTDVRPLLLCISARQQLC